MHQVGERFHLQVRQEHFAHRPHDAEHEESNDRVDQNDRRTGERDDLARAHEKTGTDRTADGDELNVAVFQPSLERPALRGGRILRVARLLHC
ncbi:hypothetical protein D9M71_794340 [compost metagenome]